MGARAVVLCFEDMAPSVSGVADQFDLKFRTAFIDAASAWCEVRLITITFAATDTANIIGTKIAAGVRAEAVSIGQSVDTNMVLIPTFAKG